MRVNSQDEGDALQTRDRHDRFLWRSRISSAPLRESFALHRIRDTYPLMETIMDQIQSIASAINGYFDLMYDADDSKFLDVFHDACLIHGFRDRQFTAWSAAQFRDVIRNRPSPAAMKSVREQEILSIEQTAPDLAMANVRIRIGQTEFIDHLIFHRIDGRWRVTTKALHVARVFPPGS